MAHGPDEWLGEMLRHVGREPAPPVALDNILERGQRRRQRRLWIGGGVIGAAAILLAALLGGSAPEEPPVHLDLRVVDVPETRVDDGVDVASWLAVPEEERPEERRP